MTNKQALEYHKEQHLIKKAGFLIALEQIRNEKDSKVISKVKVPDKSGLLGKERMVEKNVTIKNLRDQLEQKINAENEIIGIIDVMLMR